jgi:uncharacterized LabA/DUF88 family protein
MNMENKSIGVFIDGGYFAKINEALQDNLSTNISISGLFSFIRGEIARRHGLALDECFITEAHYYRGRYRANDANSKHLLFSERKFEDALIENDVIFHYKHLREVQKDGEVTIIEKGIDVWFALEAYELAVYRDFDYVVLITGDADHEMLIRKLKALKTDAILLTWDVTSNSSTSKLLREEACTHIEISKLVEENKDLIKKICKK